MINGPEIMGVQENEPIEFEIINGIKVDKKLSEELKQWIAESSSKAFEAMKPGGKNQELSEVEHKLLLGSSVPLYSQPFKPIDLVLGRDIEDIRKQRSGHPLAQEAWVSFGVKVNDDGWTWLSSIATEIYGDQLASSDAPTSMDEAREGTNEAGARIIRMDNWAEFARNGFKFLREPILMDNEGSTSFPSISKVKINKNLFSQGAEPEYIKLDVDPKQIGYPRINSIAGRRVFEFFDKDNYRFEYHEDWEPESHL
ncbi:MAG: hypothetical protein NTZ65_01285 [Candidatus Berkelbacteria bacterium]|nr:hypothetical protein [Candidatus Berkelbacteria bacterium]